MNPSLENVEATVQNLFRSKFHTEPRVISSAPGRVNLIGEHTDYNDGYVLPAAIDRRIAVAGEPRSDGIFEVQAGNLNAHTRFSLQDLAPSNTESWANYAKGIVALLHAKGLAPEGANLALQGNVPRGSGLSSSAALEVALAYALLSLAAGSLPDVTIARRCQKAEHEWAGVHCGIMDQFIAVMGKQDAALFLDCRSYEYRHVPLPPGTRVVICDTGVKRALAASAYNSRRAECDAAVAAFRTVLPHISSLRDISMAAFEEYSHLLQPPVLQRCRHVVSEIARVEQAVLALDSHDLSLFGKLMYDSHFSLQHDYEVSCPELDAVVDICAEVDGVYGARMTGAGFGGCAICLTREQDVPEIVHRLTAEYPLKTGMKPTLLVSGAEPGVAVHAV